MTTSSSHDSRWKLRPPSGLQSRERMNDVLKHTGHKQINSPAIWLGYFWEGVDQFQEVRVKSCTDIWLHQHAIPYPVASLPTTEVPVHSGPLESHSVSARNLPQLLSILTFMDIMVRDHWLLGILTFMARLVPQLYINISSTKWGTQLGKHSISGILVRVPETRARKLCNMSKLEAVLLAVLGFLPYLKYQEADVQQYGPVTMIVPASGHQVCCIPWVQTGTFNKEISFLCILKFFALNIFCGEYLQSSLHLMLQI